jgi:hypothetical protein
MSTRLAIPVSCLAKIQKGEHLHRERQYHSLESGSFSRHSLAFSGLFRASQRSMRLFHDPIVCGRVSPSLRRWPIQKRRCPSRFPDTLRVMEVVLLSRTQGQLIDTAGARTIRKPTETEENSGKTACRDEQKLVFLVKSQFPPRQIR